MGFWVLGYSVLFVGIWDYKKSPKNNLRKPGKVLNSQEDFLRNHKIPKKSNLMNSDEHTVSHQISSDFINFFDSCDFSGNRCANSGLLQAFSVWRAPQMPFQTPKPLKMLSYEQFPLLHAHLNFMFTCTFISVAPVDESALHVEAFVDQENPYGSGASVCCGFGFLAWRDSF